MSSMLEQAIIDAEQLKETAKKAAEEAVIEKYQPEIKEALEKILEQDEIGFGEEIEEDAALVTDGEGGLDLVEDLPTAQLAKEGEIVEIDLYKLEEMMAEELAEEGRLDPDDLVEREKLAEEIDEEVNISEEELKEILDPESKLDESNLINMIADMISEDMISDSTQEEAAEAAEEEAQKAGGQPGDVYAGESETLGSKKDDDKELEEKKEMSYTKNQRDTDDTDKDETGGEQYGGGGYYDYGARKKQLEETEETDELEEDQGYDAREDESLGMRTGKESGKKQSFKDRRGESYGKWGKRGKEKRDPSLEEDTTKGEKVKTGRTKGEKAYESPSKGEEITTGKHKGEKAYGTHKGSEIKTGPHKGEKAYEYPSKGEKSKTDKGEEDYTTKKGMQKKTGPGRAYTEESLALENKKITQQNNKYRTLIQHLKKEVQKVNFSNAKLLYQNRILNSVSLNERQKDNIVDAIANATTVEEAKLIFETLQSAVGAVQKKKGAESLNEVVTRSSSAFIPRKEAKPKADAFAERMKILAGLK